MAKAPKRRSAETSMRMLRPRLRSPTSAPLTFHGRFQARRSSSAYTRQPSSAPLGSWMFMNWMMRLSARSTPGTPRTRSTAVSGNVCAKSTFGVFFEVTQMSALACSMVTVALARRPMKRPTCTSTSVTAKATPATVITKRRRSCSRFLRARETMSVPAAGRGARRREAADRRLDHLLDQVWRGGRVRPVLRLQRDEQRHRAVHARPQHLRDGVDVAGAEVTTGDRALHGGAQQAEGLLSWRGGQLLGAFELVRGHEHEPVVVGIRGPELRVGQAELADPLHRIGGRRLLLEVPEQPLEVLRAQREHEVVLVLEVVVDRGGRVLDGLSDAPHGDALVAVGHEQLARGVEDLPAHLLALALLPFDDAHAPPAWDVRELAFTPLTTLTYSQMFQGCK